MGFPIGLLGGLLFCGLAHAESVHLSSPGVVLSGSFELAGKTLPLPHGEFILAAARVDEARMVEGNLGHPRAQLASVFLAQLDGGSLKSAVWASAVLEPPAPRGKWVPSRQPCSRGKALFRRDLADDKSNGEHARQNCLIVERRMGAFGADTAGLMKDAAAWLSYHDVVLPVRTLITAEITRVEDRELLRATYAFRPASYGCTAPSAAFVDSVTAWGIRVQQHFDDLVAGRASAPFTSGIHQCPSDVAHNIAAPRTPLASPCFAGTMGVSKLCE